MEFESLSPDNNSRSEVGLVLGEREENAIKIALESAFHFANQNISPIPMRIRITEENPFNFRGFVARLHERGVDVVSTLKEIEENYLSFQPFPFTNDRYESILKDVIVIPEGLEKYFI